jgi:crotonobetainyl-CoA:carnitine CoA-transferase CaiB-like acyl-CoA transferase
MKIEGLDEGVLEGIRVLDFGHALAGPFAATLLADHGADVIKIERPGAGDAMRDLGPVGPSGRAWWKSMGRGKRCLALDWKHPRSRPVIESLVRAADVLVESFRPGVLEKNDLGPDVLHAWNPGLIVLRVSGYGQTGPYSARPGFGKAAEALSGLCDLTGFPDGPPMHPGFPMGDMTTGLMGAFGVMLALQAVRRGGRGQVIDLGIYETPMRLIDYHVPIRTGTDRMPARNGNRQPMSFAPSGIYRTSDGQWITYSAATFPVAQRVLRLIGADELAGLDSLTAVCAYDDEIDERMQAWVSQRTADQVLAAFRSAEAVAEWVYGIDDILADPHVAARGNIVAVDGDPCKVVNVVPRLSDTPGRVRWLGRAVGSDTIEVLREVAGLDSGSIRTLVEAGAVAIPPDAPDGASTPPSSEEDARAP